MTQPFPSTTPHSAGQAALAGQELDRQLAWHAHELPQLIEGPPRHESLLHLITQRPGPHVISFKQASLSHVVLHWALVQMI
jgi:hypothetical protein